LMNIDSFLDVKLCNSRCFEGSNRLHLKNQAFQEVDGITTLQGHIQEEANIHANYPTHSTAQGYFVFCKFLIYE